MQLSISNAYSLMAILLILFSNGLYAQGDCTSYEEESDERLACQYARKAITFKQGSRQSQLLFDSAILLKPNYAWAYYEKSVPYLKRGLLNEGMQLLNKAVALEPLNYLPYRAYWFFQHKSYAYCSADLEKYYALEGAYPQNTPGGALSMRIVLGLTYAHQGDNQRAIDIIHETIDDYPSEDHIAPYDFHALGVLYLQNEQYPEAQEALLMSTIRNEQFADSYYYLALIAEQSEDLDAARYYINEAILRYEGKKNGYTGYPFCFPVSKQIAEAKMKELN